MSSAQARMRVGSTGRYSANLQKDDGTYITEAAIDSATIDLEDEATGTAIRDGVTIHNGTAAVGDFDFTDTTDADGNNITVMGWHIQASDVAIQTSGNTRESHLAKFTINYTDGSESKTIIHRVRLDCIDIVGLCTFEDVIEYLPGVTDESEVSRPLIDQQIEAMTERMELLCRRRFPKSTAAAPTTEVFSPGPRETSLWLERYPVDSITSVKEASDGAFAGATAVDADDYYVTPRGILRLRGGFFMQGMGSVQVIYAGGLYRQVGAAPMDIRHACARQVAAMWSQRSNLGVSAVSMGGASTTRFITDMLPDVEAVLAKYKRARW